MFVEGFVYGSGSRTLAQSGTSVHRTRMGRRKNSKAPYVMRRNMPWRDTV
jgi:hypothetical protein